MKEVKDSMLKSNEVRLGEEKARANREFAAIESSIKQLSVSIRDEINKESKRNLEQLLEEMQEQKASNEIFRKTCEEALLKTKNVDDGIEQEIKNTKSDKTPHPRKRSAQNSQYLFRPSLYVSAREGPSSTETHHVAWVCCPGVALARIQSPCQTAKAPSHAAHHTQCHPLQPIKSQGTATE